MKALKKDLKSVMRELKALTKKTEALAKKLEKLEKAQATKESKPKVKARKAKKKAAARKVTAKRAGKTPASDVIFKIIGRRKKGVDTATLKDVTGFKDKKVRDVIYRLKKQGKIKSASTGIYVKI